MNEKRRKKESLKKLYRLGGNWEKSDGDGSVVENERGSRGWRRLRRIRFIAFKLRMFFLTFLSSNFV